MSDWIKLQDSEWTPELIMAEIADRANRREVELGPLEIKVPPFSYESGMPRLAQDSPYSADLLYHLRLLNEKPPLEMVPILVDLPATQTPLVGSIWERMRRKFHDLILFYVNRAAQQQDQVNDELIGTLNALTRALETQQEQNQPSREDLSAPRKTQEAE